MLFAPIGGLNLAEGNSYRDGGPMNVLRKLGKAFSEHNPDEIILSFSVDDVLYFEDILIRDLHVARAATKRVFILPCFVKTKSELYKAGFANSRLIQVCSLTNTNILEELIPFTWFAMMESDRYQKEIYCDRMQNCLLAKGLRLTAKMMPTAPLATGEDCSSTTQMIALIPEMYQAYFHSVNNGSSVTFYPDQAIIGEARDHFNFFFHLRNICNAFPLMGVLAHVPGTGLDNSKARTAFQNVLECSAKLCKGVHITHLPPPFLKRHETWGRIFNDADQIFHVAGRLMRSNRKVMTVATYDILSGSEERTYCGKTLNINGFRTMGERLNHLGYGFCGKRLPMRNKMTMLQTMNNNSETKFTLGVTGVTGDCSCCNAAPTLHQAVQDRIKKAHEYVADTRGVLKSTSVSGKHLPMYRPPKIIGRGKTMPKGRYTEYNPPRVIGRKVENKENQPPVSNRSTERVTQSAKPDPQFDVYDGESTDLENTNTIVTSQQPELMLGLSEGDIPTNIEDVMMDEFNGLLEIAKPGPCELSTLNNIDDLLSPMLDNPEETAQQQPMDPEIAEITNNMNLDLNAPTPVVRVTDERKVPPLTICRRYDEDDLGDQYNVDLDEDLNRYENVSSDSPTDERCYGQMSGNSPCPGCADEGYREGNSSSHGSTASSSEPGN